MTIHLPANRERPILAAVDSGRYASLDDAMPRTLAGRVDRHHHRLGFRS
jgi:Arc/MetJ-type ribon-helix-helix transcriptional regulator